MKKKILFTLSLLASTVFLFGQQEALFSHFTANKLLFNPGYVGSGGKPCLALTHREQWAGLEGAPSTSAFMIHTPLFHKKVGVGLSIMNDNIGYHNILTINGLYSYRILFEESFLSFGLQGSYRKYDGDEGEVVTTQGGDLTAEAPIEPFNVFNVGFGIYYESKNYFLGASVPRLLKKDLYGNGAKNHSDNAGELPHFYLMGGVIVELEKIKLKPAFLTKYVPNAPINFDLHFSISPINNFWLGATYRWGTHPQSGAANSFVSCLIEYRVKGFKIGAGYDYGLGKIQNSNSGSFELMLGYCFTKTDIVPNPRFF